MSEPATTSKPSRLYTIQLYLLWFVLLLVSALSLAGFFSAQDQACELLSHFRIVWVTLLILVIAWTIMAKQRAIATLAAIILCVNSFDIIRLYLPDNRAPKSANRQQIKILAMNVAGDNNLDYDSVFSLISETKPDIVGISEVNPAWLKKLNEKLIQYPYRVAVSKSDGIALFSRVPIRKSELRYSKLANRPRICASVEVNGRAIALDFAHPLLPVLPKLRNEELEEIAEEARLSPIPIVVFGDLNCTPWSAYFEKLLVSGKLHDTEQGFGPQPTWNAMWFIPLLPIDHCLTSAEFKTEQRKTCPSITSDHLPIFIRLTLN